MQQAFSLWWRERELDLWVHQPKFHSQDDVFQVLKSDHNMIEKAKQKQNYYIWRLDIMERFVFVCFVSLRQDRTTKTEQQTQQHTQKGNQKQKSSFFLNKYNIINMYTWYVVKLFAHNHNREVRFRVSRHIVLVRIVDDIKMQRRKLRTQLWLNWKLHRSLCNRRH